MLFPIDPLHGLRELRMYGLCIFSRGMQSVGRLLVPQTCSYVRMPCHRFTAKRDIGGPAGRAGRTGSRNGWSGDFHGPFGFMNREPEAEQFFDLTKLLVFINAAERKKTLFDPACL